MQCSGFNLDADAVFLVVGYFQDILLHIEHCSRGGGLEMFLCNILTKIIQKVKVAII